jgi:hypothetical protein
MQPSFKLRLRQSRRRALKLAGTCLSGGCASHPLLDSVFHASAEAQPGLGWRDIAAEHYGLRHVRSVPMAGKSGRLIEHYALPDGTPWLSMPHWTAARGLSAADKVEMKAYAAALI